MSYKAEIVDDTKMIIPERIRFKMFACLNVSSERYDFGKIVLDLHNYETLYKDDENQRWKLIKEVEVEIEFEPAIYDIREELIETIEAKMQMELAEHHMKMQEFEQKLQTLKCIEYHPVQQPIKETFDDIPF